VKQTIVLVPGRKDASRATNFLNSLPLDRPWKVDIEEYKPRRTDNQNNYLWGVVYPTIQKFLEGWEKDDIHEYCLGECFGWEELEGLKRKRVKPLKRSSKLSKQEFSDYVSWIQRDMAGRGIYIPDPEET